MEIRGQVATGDFTWTPQNFAGFYYDIDDDIGTESLTTAITEGNKLSGDPHTASPTVSLLREGLQVRGLGHYNVIGFMAKKYFAGYIQDGHVPAENQVSLRSVHR